MHAKTILSLLIAAALIGCTLPKNAAVTRPKATTAVRAHIIVSPPSAPGSGELMSTKTLAATPAYTLPTPADVVMELRGTNLVLSWPISMSNYSVIYSPHAYADLRMWSILPREGSTVTPNDTRLSVVITNSFPRCLFALVKPIPGYITLYWSYDFEACPEVTSFVLYQGSKSRCYTNTMLLDYKCQWCQIPVLSDTNYYALTARSGSGLESNYSEEACYVASTNK
jgi:hypothetical protein